MVTQCVPAKVLQNVFLWLRKAVELEGLEQNHGGGNDTAKGRRKKSFPWFGLSVWWESGGEVRASLQITQGCSFPPGTAWHCPRSSALGGLSPCTCCLSPYPVHAPVGSCPCARGNGVLSPRGHQRDEGTQAVLEQGWPWEPGPAARAWLSPAPTASRAKPAAAEVLCEPGYSVPAANRPASPWCCR